MIRLARAAQSDLRRIARQITDNNGAAVADRILAEILAGMHRVKRFPQLGRIGRSSGTRELGISGTEFIVVYRPDPATIFIVRVIHGAMRWPP